MTGISSRNSASSVSVKAGIDNVASQFNRVSE